MPPETIYLLPNTYFSLLKVMLYFAALLSNSCSTRLWSSMAFPPRMMSFLVAATFSTTLTTLCNTLLLFNFMQLSPRLLKGFFRNLVHKIYTKFSCAPLIFIETLVIVQNPSCDMTGVYNCICDNSSYSE